MLLSVVREKSSEDSLEESCIHVAGVAYSGGSGKKIQTVEISVDDGRTWIEAELRTDEIIATDASASSFGWVRFYSTVNVTAGDEAENTEVICRATDEDGTTQPRISPKQRGYLYNGYNRITV